MTNKKYLLQNFLKQTPLPEYAQENFIFLQSTCVVIESAYFYILLYIYILYNRKLKFLSNSIEEFCDQ